MKTAISTILNKDEVEFDNLQMERYMRWCMNIALKNGIDLQIIIANSSINKYYNHEFSKLENKFLNLVNGKTKWLEPKALEDMYSIIVVDMFKIYPNPLIEEARKIKIENPSYVN
jgi:hypothetical protein